MRTSLQPLVSVRRSTHHHDDARDAGRGAILAADRASRGNAMLALDGSRGRDLWDDRSAREPTCPCTPIRIRTPRRPDSLRARDRSPLPEPGLCEPSPHGARDAQGKQPPRQHGRSSQRCKDPLPTRSRIHRGEHLSRRPRFRQSIPPMPCLPTRLTADTTQRSFHEVLRPLMPRPLIGE